MRLFHTLRTSLLLTTRLWKHNSCSAFIFIPGKNLSWQGPLEPFWIPLCVSVHKSTTWNQTIYEKFQWLLLADPSARIYLRSVTSGVIVCYPITATSRVWTCHTICWIVLCQAFLSLLPLPPLPSKIFSPLALEEGLILRLSIGRSSALDSVPLSYHPWAGKKTKTRTRTFLTENSGEFQVRITPNILAIPGNVFLGIPRNSKSYFARVVFL